MPPNIKWLKKELVWLKFNDDSIVKANIVQPGISFIKDGLLLLVINNLKHEKFVVSFEYVEFVLI